MLGPSWHAFHTFLLRLSIKCLLRADEREDHSQHALIFFISTVMLDGAAKVMHVL